MVITDSFHCTVFSLLMGAKNFYTYINVATKRGSRTEEIPRDRPVYLHCRTSQRSYNAIMALKGRGFDNIINISGSFLGISCYEYFTDVTTGWEKIVTEYNFM